MAKNRWRRGRKCAAWRDEQVH